MATKKVNKSIAMAVSLVSISVSLYTQIIWVVVATQKGLSSQREKLDSFLNFFPVFIRSIAAITYAVLICAILGIIFSIIWKNGVMGAQRILPIVILIFSILILLLNLFSLM